MYHKRCLSQPERDVTAFGKEEAIMSSDDQQGFAKRFFVKQAVLLVITIILVAFFTVPLVKIVKAALNPGELKANLDRANQTLAGVETELDVTRSKMAVRSKAMIAPGDEIQEQLKKEMEELKRQKVLQDLEIKHLQDQLALTQTVLQVLKPASPAAPPPGVDFWHKMTELATKIMGCVASMFSGGLFILSWWRKRGQSPQAEGEDK
jgi:hypothetical protein